MKTLFAMMSICMAPVDEPTGGAYFGGDVAAPVFSQTVQQTLRMMGVQPDMAVKPQVVTKVEKESF